LGSEVPYSHDIARLLLLLEQADVDVTDLLTLRAFANYAVQFRYDDEPEDLGLDRTYWCAQALEPIRWLRWPIRIATKKAKP